MVDAVLLLYRTRLHPARTVLVHDLFSCVRTESLIDLSFTHTYIYLLTFPKTRRSLVNIEHLVGLNKELIRDADERKSDVRPEMQGK